MNERDARRFVAGCNPRMFNVDDDEDLDVRAALDACAVVLLTPDQAHWVVSELEMWRGNRAMLLDLVARGVRLAGGDAAAAALAGVILKLVSGEELRPLLQPLMPALRRSACAATLAAAGLLDDDGDAAPLWEDADASDDPHALVLSPAFVDVFGVAVLRRGPPARSPYPTAAASFVANCRSLAEALNAPRRPPVVVAGKRGAGRTAAIRELASRCGAVVREFVLDEACDARALVGYHEVAEDGRFSWRRGPLALAVERGEWAVVEDVDRASLEVLALLKPLAEGFSLGAAGRALASESVRRHAGFRLLGTATTEEARFLGREHWVEAYCRPLDRAELMAIVGLPASVAAAVVDAAEGSARDAIKMARRVRDRVNLEEGPYAPEAKRLLAAVEACDVVLGRCRGDAAEAEANVAEAFGLEPDHLRMRVRASSPQITSTPRGVQVGRVVLETTGGAPDLRFAPTPHAARLLERVAACVASREPVLLVGEPGGGKTTLVQVLARHCGATLRVLNLSHATDAEELLGGVRPVSVAEVSRRLRDACAELFAATFDAAANAAFLGVLDRAFAASDWAKVARGAAKACDAYTKSSKRRKLDAGQTAGWARLATQAQILEKRCAEPHRLAFAFMASALADAAAKGDWVLLDEVNLAPGDVLQHLLPMLEGRDVHGQFRVFAAMNPSGDAGKRELPPAVRSRFTELFVSEPSDDADLIAIAETRLAPLDDLHRAARRDAAALAVATHRRLLDLVRTGPAVLTDGGGQAPRYSLRTLCRALDAACVLSVKGGPVAALREGFELAYATQLVGDAAEGGRRVCGREIREGLGASMASDMPPRRPSRFTDDDADLVAGFWVAAGPKAGRVDAALLGDGAAGAFCLTPTVTQSLRRVARALAFGRAPILLQGPTCAGKTSLIDYLARRLNVRCARINNHEHTDVAEYVGRYAPLPDGTIGWLDGALTGAVRRGEWILLDELNLAPPDVLEALNRLLDDNRELRLPETGEVITPHANFRLFATQNPASCATSGAQYGGRKPLSRAFRDRFVEIHVDEPPPDELAQIVKRVGGVPPSLAAKLVDARRRLARLRLGRGREGGTLLDGDAALCSARDVLKWAKRLGGSADKARALLVGDDLLAQRLRCPTDVRAVRACISQALEANLDDERTWASVRDVCMQQNVAPTAAMARLVQLMGAALDHEEPVLLVGETGGGKTTACQLLAAMRGQQLRVLNCHLHSEASDFLGALRPARRESGGALFEWVDGCLVEAMRRGEMVLLDELNLADDAVLERLNSVLEPARTIALAEKGGDALEIVTAHPAFRLLATMNPGGDHGKRELSPALRSRFTELWAPACSSREDLRALVATTLPDAAATEALLDFGEFIKGMADDVKPPPLTARDLVHWAAFVKHLEGKVDVVEALGHGCGVVLDGLGVANPCVEADALEACRDVCERRFAEICRGMGDVEDALKWDRAGPPLARDAHVYGAAPFALEARGDFNGDAFCDDAPTTAANLRRVVRACQLERAVLLEGPPGVGKSALIGALARRCGRELERINLSEHSDVQDLVGADLPADDGFSWRDGPLLRALRRGSWVLLDELNLAPQPVLEALNAVLDHRGTLYVPELGEAVAKGRGFRLFATQNPHGGVSGRRALPKSFLDRFFRVHVAALTLVDFEAVAYQKYALDEGFARECAACVDRIRREGVFGLEGDVNARDVERLCEVVSSREDASVSQIAAEVFGPRCADDEQRRKLEKAVGAAVAPACPVDLAPDCLRAGGVALARAFAIAPAAGDDDDGGAPRRIARDNNAAPSLASLARCVRQRWPALVYGAGRAPVEPILRLAEACGASVWRVRLHPASDVTDLLGGFEQVDAERLRRRAAARCRDARADPGCVEKARAAEAAERRAAASGNEPPRFEWVDGPVTRAARRGAWLVLEDANLAPPSVLDRLNALLEPGGELTVTEADGAARAVRPAPAFRAFLTVDQQYGDVSRAMRNRCCHVCVAAAPPSASDPLDIDQGAGSWRARVLDPASQRARDDADFVAGEAPAEAAARGRIIDLRRRAATGDVIDSLLALQDLVMDGHAIDDAHERHHYKADVAYALQDLLASPDVTECGGRIVRESDVAQAWGDARRAGASARRRILRDASPAHDERVRGLVGALDAVLHERDALLVPGDDLVPLERARDAVAAWTGSADLGEAQYVLLAITCAMVRKALVGDDAPATTARAVLGRVEALFRITDTAPCRLWKRAAKEAGWPRAPLHAQRVDGVTTAARDLAFPGRGDAGLAPHAALAAALAVDGAMRRDAADARATQAWALATRRDCPDYGFLGEAWAAARAAAATRWAARGVPLQNDEGGEDVVVLWACDDGGLLDRWAHVQSCACAAVSVARAEAAVVADVAEADATGGGVDGAACDRLAGAILAETTRPPTDASAFISLGWVRAKNVGAAATLRRVTNGVVGRWARACDVAPYLADRDGLALAPRAAAAAEPLPGALAGDALVCRGLRLLRAPAPLVAVAQRCRQLRAVARLLREDAGVDRARRAALRAGRAHLAATPGAPPDVQRRFDGGDVGGGWAALGAARVLALAACALDPGARAAAKLEAHDHHVKVVEVAHRAALADAARFGDRGLVGEARRAVEAAHERREALAARATFERASDAPPWASLREALGRCAVLATRIAPLLDALDRRSADARAAAAAWRAAAAEAAEAIDRAHASSRLDVVEPLCAALRTSCFGLLLRLEEDRDAGWRFPFGAAAPSDPVFDLWRCELDDMIQGRRSSAFDEALQRVVAAWRDRAPTEADERRLASGFLARGATAAPPAEEGEEAEALDTTQDASLLHVACGAWFRRARGAGDAARLRSAAVRAGVAALDRGDDAAHAGALAHVLESEAALLDPSIDVVPKNARSLVERLAALGLPEVSPDVGWGAACARDAVGPCTRLLERCAELLKQWPQNATLERIVRVGDALLSSKIEVLGKVLAGLEVLLHRAQDWEEHAARHVTLEDELKAIRAVVARWRGVEVKRWPSLIQGVEERSVSSEVLESFLRLRELIPTTQNSIPAWLRKDLPFYDDEGELISEDAFDRLDGFLRDGTRGDFSARVELVKTLGEATGRHEVRALADQYGLALPDVLKDVEKARAQHLKELADESKLASWDDRNYHRLEACTLASRKTLRRILGAFRDVLMEPVAPILQRRAAPPDGAAPLVKDEAIEEEARVFGPAPLIGVAPATTYGPRLPQLATRMRAVLSSKPASDDAAERVAATILGRCAYLREHPATPRAVKRRAVVDLARGLKGEGLGGAVPAAVWDARTGACAAAAVRHDGGYFARAAAEVQLLRHERAQHDRDVTPREAAQLKSACARLQLLLLRERVALGRLQHDLERCDVALEVLAVDAVPRDARILDAAAPVAARGAEVAAQLRLAGGRVDAHALEKLASSCETTKRRLASSESEAGERAALVAALRAAAASCEGGPAAAAARTALEELVKAARVAPEGDGGDRAAAFDACVEAALLTAQRLREDDDQGETVGDQSSARVTRAATLKLGRLADALEALARPTASSSNVTLAVAALSVVVPCRNAAMAAWREDARRHRSLAKLCYVCCRVVRALFARGLCEESDDDGPQDSGRTEDCDGTGMGEGDVSEAKDVSNEIDNEEQLLGLKDEARKEHEGDNDGQQEKLRGEEKDQGVEMEGAFDGERREQEDDDDGEDDGGDDVDDEGEEVDRELGDAGDDAEAVDERLWGGDDDDREGDADNKDEAMPEASRADGEAATDDVRAREEEAGDGAPPPDPEQAKEDADVGDDDDGAAPPAADEAARPPGRDDAREDAAKDAKAEEEVVEEVGDGGDGDDGEEAGAYEDAAGYDDAGDGGDDDAGEALPDSMEIDEPAAEGDGDDEIEEAEGGRPEDVEAEDEDGDAAGGADAAMDAAGDDAEDVAAAATAAGESALAAENRSDARAAAGEGAAGAATQIGGDALAGGDAGAGGDGAEGAASAGDAAGGGGGGGGGSAQAAAPAAAAAASERRAPNPYATPAAAAEHWRARLAAAEAASADNNDDDDAGGGDRFEFTDRRADAAALGGAGDDAADRPGEAPRGGADEPVERARGVDEGNEAVDAPPGDDAMDASDDEAATPAEANQSRTRAADDPEAETSATAGGGAAPRPEHRDADGDEEMAEAAPLAPGDAEGAEDEAGPSSINVDPALLLDRDAMDVEHASESNGEGEPYLAEDQWRDHQRRAAPVARRLAEALRVVLEPTVTARLKGDYRTGKRLNMRRVLDYVASGYRRDKIWLRRTRPSKRCYQIFIALDDSRSMRDHGGADAALAALAALVGGLRALEAGDLSIAAFGDAVRLLHPFQGSCPSEAQLEALAKRFTFADEKTRCGALLDRALEDLREARLRSAGRAAPLQLVLLVSDGRFDASARAQLRRAQRDAVDAGVAVVLVLLDRPGRDSILEMQIVAFNAQGGVAISPYLDGYPFPCYVVLRDVRELPETLAAALKQWFEFHHAA